MDETTAQVVILLGGFAAIVFGLVLVIMGLVAFDIWRGCRP